MPDRGPGANSSTRKSGSMSPMGPFGQTRSTTSCPRKKPLRCHDNFSRRWITCTPAPDTACGPTSRQIDVLRLARPHRPCSLGAAGEVAEAGLGVLEVALVAEGDGEQGPAARGLLDEEALAGAADGLAGVAAAQGALGLGEVLGGL